MDHHNTKLGAIVDSLGTMLDKSSGDYAEMSVMVAINGKDAKARARSIADYLGEALGDNDIRERESGDDAGYIWVGPVGMRYDSEG